MQWVNYKRQWHRMYSVRWNIAGTLLTAGATAAPLASGAAAWSDSIGIKLTLILAGLIFLASIVGALIDQGLEPDPPKRRKSNAGMGTQ